MIQNHKQSNNSKNFIIRVCGKYFWTWIDKKSICIIFLNKKSLPLYDKIDALGPRQRHYPAESL